jgi:4-amino-4-deoxy-L-arabinose transferase-like glycosyltransferase
MAIRIRWIFIFLTGLYLARLYLIGSTTLAPDEAFYWYWSKNPDWSYLDHPPMVAYIMALFTALGGDTAFFVRIGGLLCTVLAQVFLLLTVKRIDPSNREGRWEVLLILNSTLLLSAGCLVQTPDTPLLLFWSLALYCGVSIAMGGGSGWWYMFGIALGLGMLSKYTMVLIIPCQFLFLLLSTDHRRWLRHPAPYLALCIAIVLFSPVIYWNWQHDWISFGFQLNQGFSSDDDPLLFKLGEYLGGQLGVVTPLLFLIFIYYSIKALPDVFRNRRNVIIYLFCLSWPVFFFFGVSTAVGEVAEANWPAPAYIAGMLLAWMVFRYSYKDRRAHKRFMWTAIGLGVLLNLVLTIHLVNPIIPVAPHQDTTRQFHGWRALGQNLNEMITDHPSENGYLLMANRATTVAEIVFYTGNRYTGIHLFQLEKYTFLRRLEELRGKDALIVLHHFSQSQIQRYEPFFEEISVIGTNEYRFRNAINDKLSATILLGKHFKGTDGIL